ncbi:1-deoxy-D-xylulose-5-phosphate reductoisomerase [Pseudomonas syringae]|uniref:1-deoxy-D-xylulose 5-phosphate reductoisomerase n=1 Tax=Pseudomonas syringae TaxID=317 RepID=A0A9Q3X4L1_PSESX|nr:1-deoxy-D-xylulose-5-phosphate reductoisomerase [Pseudomonas syringae]MCF5062552.1 1-deoxy-D-xylulose-5-phosphate reductoisomerase [Pseudomonas syringae]MCF5072512.1 1-deoxy-D-xylulose-5-phosphate reductoisomerase [Pseudomonas syringae]MCF5116811.1 1-deoxy-D-xylulose-5-phosphate reductoisomerase [Pseudomonas syringae]MCF5376714.1 1-deoxy-D-xylulose-5-phosphate reductoisomerase [Pseudomonas syringae]
MMQRLLVLGSTGSVGDSVLDVVARHPEAFMVHGLTAHRRMDKLYQQCLRFRPAIAVVSEPQHAIELQAHLLAAGVPTEVLCGNDALCAAARESQVDTVVAAIVGAAGLLPTLSAARAGKKILLANKEALVVSGALFIETAARAGAVVIPLDSEHNAIFQCLQGCHGTLDGVERLVLTASGGPFRDWPLDCLADATPEQACAHPNWSMGRKISVDCATMMNKGLEIIEAHWLFNLPAERIEALIHPQSVVHSMVVFRDQSVMAQLGNPDMRMPVAHALAYPQRIESGVAPLDLTRYAGLTFEHPDVARFPCLGLALQVLADGARASAAMNAANEVAVEAFLGRRIRFTQICEVVEQTLQHIDLSNAVDLEAILGLDRQARRLAREHVRHCVSSA